MILPITLDVFLQALLLQYLISMLVRWTDSVGNAFREDPSRAVLAWEALWHLFIPRFIIVRIRAPVAAA